jgi:C-terminal processing protease CtpA/Prc
VIAELGRQLHRFYVFPDVADTVATALIAKDARGGYAADRDVEALAQALSQDLRMLGKDGHFRVGYAPGYQPQPTTLSPAPLPQAEHDRMQHEVASMAYGIQRVERLDGNVGYLELRAFGPTDMVGAALTSAMTMLSGTDALILDLRRNGGGDPATVAYLMSHFFAAGDRRHLNDIRTRAIARTDEYWTTPDVGVHYDKPVYVLVSGRTFSGGEEFAYDMQTQKRATLVGETTGGGANPGDDFPIGHDFVAFIPTGQSINPVTHTNWEHVGVKPDVAVPAADAQQAAYLAILHELLAAATDPEQRDYLQHTLDQAQPGAKPAPDYARRP